MKDNVLDFFTYEECLEGCEYNFLQYTRTKALLPEASVVPELMKMVQHYTTPKINEKYGRKRSPFVNSFPRSCENINDVLGALALGAVPTCEPTGADAYLPINGEVHAVESKVIYLDSGNLWNHWKRTICDRIQREYKDNSTSEVKSYHSVKFDCATLENMGTKGRYTYMVLADKGVPGCEIVAVYCLSPEKTLEILRKSAQGKRLVKGITDGSSAIEISMAEFIREGELYSSEYSLPQSGLDAYYKRLLENTDLSVTSGVAIDHAEEYLHVLWDKFENDKEAREMVFAFQTIPGAKFTRAAAENLWARALGIDNVDDVLWCFLDAAPTSGCEQWPDPADKWSGPIPVYNHGAAGTSDAERKRGIKTRPKTTGYREAENGRYRDIVIIGHYGRPGHERLHAYRIPYSFYNNHTYNLRISLCSKTHTTLNADVFSQFEIELPLTSLQEAKKLEKQLANKKTQVATSFSFVTHDMQEA